jgi:hypothetical protein
MLCLTDPACPIVSAVVVPVVSTVLETEVHLAFTLYLCITGKRFLHGLVHGDIHCVFPSIKTAVHPDVVGTALRQQSTVLDAHFLSTAGVARFHGNTIVQVHRQIMPPFLIGSFLFFLGTPELFM